MSGALHGATGVDEPADALDLHDEFIAVAWTTAVLGKFPDDAKWWADDGQTGASPS